MFETRRWVTVLMIAGAAAVATAQNHVGGTAPGGMGDAGGKIEPTVGDGGQAFCFGDGSGVVCPARNDGSRGRGCENSWGMGGALLAAHGLARISQDSVVLNVDGLPPATTVLFMEAGKPVYQPYPYGDGLMCLGGSVVHLAVRRTVGWSARFPEPGDPSLSSAGRLPRLGATVYYQVLYRDEQPFATRVHLNLSNGWCTTWVP
jgi:hypothetical protein